MYKVIFYPVGNGDTSQIKLDNGKRILFDFRHQQKGEDPESPVINLKAKLREELEEERKDYFDVVAFTHADDDHIAGSTDFFELDHTKKCQGDGRVKIKELWVPSAMLVETAAQNQQSKEFVLLRQEARYRLREGYGIRVFSKPKAVKSLLEKLEIPFEERRHLFTDAGQLAEGFSLATDGVEFFCHSPFIEHVDGEEVLRNEASLIFQVRFKIDEVVTDFFAVGDTTADVLEKIVSITKYHERDDRLNWDLYNIPHHCSYLALSNEKGENETEPVEGVKELLLKGQFGASMVSSSNPIDSNKEAYEQCQPPHIQAKKCYERYLKEVHGRKLLVTMEEPNRKKPIPIEFEISRLGMRLIAVSAGFEVATSRSAPRAGYDG